MSQNKQILEYLKNHPEGLTSMDAIVKFGCTRLAARIRDIKDKFLIQSEVIESMDEHSGSKNFVRYVYRDNTISQIKMF